MLNTVEHFTKSSLVNDVEDDLYYLGHNLYTDHRLLREWTPTKMFLFASWKIKVQVVLKMLKNIDIIIQFLKMLSLRNE